ncbi:MAG: peptidoglycan DD-metalloendopeptidase family protein [Acidimicrobiia bacterium]|nr:peptidoglycan DD-metalloendopeptidase family protein [Acidimicrobiia bacterium]
MLRRTVLFICLSLLVSITALPAAGVTDADIQQARDRLAAARNKANAATARLHELTEKLEAAREQVARTEAEVKALQEEEGKLTATLRARAVAAYKAGFDVGSLRQMLGINALEDSTNGDVYMAAVLEADDRNLRKISTVRGDLEDKQRQLAAEAEVIRTTTEAAATEKRNIDAALATAQAEEQKLVEQKAAEDKARAEAAARALEEAKASSRGGESRQLVAAPPGGAVCPVQGAVSFTDSYGASRSGGRSHKGVDMMAMSGTPLVAITDGTIIRASASESGLGGITLWLRDGAGNTYYYAHNKSNVVDAGAQVSAGQLIAYVGNTGNARYTAAHVHFEYHPGGGDATNPTPLVASLC